MRFKKFLIAAAAIGWLAALSPGYAQEAEIEPTTMEEELISLDFNNVDIRLVIRLISDLTGKNFLIHDSVRGPVTIISPSKIPVNEVEKVLDSILEVRGYAAVPSGEITKILPKVNASQSTIDTRGGDQVETIPAYDELITQLIPLEYADAEELRRIIQPLISKGSNLMTYPPTNTIILTEAASNIKRLLFIIGELDIPGGEAAITVVPLEWASASIMASEIMQVIQEGKIPTGGRRAPQRKGARQPEALKIIPDERTNSLIIVATPKQTESLLNLIEKLDTSTPAGKTRINVYRLKYAKAEDLATVLTNLTSKKKLGPTEEPIIITSYKDTNSLVVDASPQDYILIEKIINDLDIARDQVLIELILTEVNLAKSLTMGFEANTITSILTAEEWTDEDLFWGGEAFDNALQNVFIDNATGNFNTRSSPFPSTLGGTWGFMHRDDDRAWMNFAALLELLQADREFNVLSAPQVLTADNEEVEFEVVQNTPFPTSSIISTETQAVGGELQNIDYRDVGVKIKLTPQISPDRTVLLAIDQSIENITGSVEVSGQSLRAPETLKRVTKTTISVRDKDVVVMSGIISDRKNEQVSKVPVLGDLPYFGPLFRSKVDSWEKVNLLIFIRPHIITSPNELLEVTELLRERSEDFLREGYGQPPRSLDLYLEELEREPTERPPKIMELFYNADRG